MKWMMNEFCFPLISAAMRNMFKNLSNPNNIPLIVRSGDENIFHSLEPSYRQNILMTVHSILSNLILQYSQNKKDQLFSIRNVNTELYLLGF